MFRLDDPLEVRGDQPVVKTVVETNTTALDNFLNKSPAHGPVGGLLDRYTTRILGQGDQLALQIDARTDGIAKAFAFDNITIVLLPDGDFDDDGQYDCADVDNLTAEIAGITHNPDFDLTGDGVLNQLDLEAWLAEAGAANLPWGNPYSPADATLNGATDGEDFTVWNAHKFTHNSNWCSGDFNADGLVDGRDFTLWNAHKFTSASTVPEPGTALLLLLLLLWRPIHRLRQMEAYNRYV